MSAEFWAIIGVGVALGGIMFRQSVQINSIDSRLARVEGMLEVLMRGLHIEIKGGGSPHA